jgi:rubredoxin
MAVRRAAQSSSPAPDDVRRACGRKVRVSRENRRALPPAGASGAHFPHIIAVAVGVRNARAPPHRTQHDIAESELKKYMCLICGWVYDEATGAPDEGIAAGTKWEDVPPNWTCPECGARREDFEMIEL